MLPHFMDFPGDLDGEESACNVGDLGLIPGLGRPPTREKWQPTPVLSPEKSPERSLAWLHSMGSQRVGHNWETELN